MEDTVYIFEDDYTMKREYGETPNGNDMAGRWVLRDEDNEIVDFNKYRNDIIDAYNLTIKEVY